MNDPLYFADHAAMLAELAQQDRYRQLIDEKGIDFSSNDYLGLASSPRIKAAVMAAAERGVPSGSGGSRLLRGNNAEHELLEQEAARFFGTEAALFFANGFMANMAVFAALPQRGDLVVYDALIHASAHEGMRLGRAETAAAKHNDVGAFGDVINSWRKSGGTGQVWIAVESLYSMDGDRAPLAELATLATQHDAYLLIDEAHATGVFGPDGRGLGAELDGAPNVIGLHTCGKALGCEGALLTGPQVMKDFIINRARAFIFSTAPSPLMASAVREALRILQDEPERRTRLQALFSFAHSRLLPNTEPDRMTQIIPIILGEDHKAMAGAALLQAKGFDVRGIRPPTVAAGTARLRVSITLNVTQQDIANLADAMGEIVR